MFPEREAIEVDAVMRALDSVLPHSSASASGRLRAMVQNMAQDGVRRDDPMRELFARAGDKWSMLLLQLLHTGSYRHSVLRRLVSIVGSEGRISQRMLTLRLRALERDGLLERAVISTQPPGVEYALTQLGADLVQQLNVVMQWIRDHQAEIRAARERFERGEADSNLER